MSEVLDKVREKFPAYADVPDDELALRIGSKYPSYLEGDEAFKSEFAQAAGKRATDLAMQNNDIVMGLLTNPAAAEASAQGRAQNEAERNQALQSGMTPYQRADVESIGRGQGKAQTGMEKTSELTSAIGSAVQPAVKAVGKGLAAAGRAAKDIAGAYAFEAIGQPEMQAKQLGITSEQLTKLGNVGVEPDTGAKPLEEGMALLPTAPRIASEAAYGLVESAPRVGSVLAMQALGIPAPVGAGLAFGVNEEGFSPKDAAVAAALPYIGKFTGQITGTIAKRFGVSSAKAVQAFETAGGAAGAAGYLGTIQASEIANLPEDQRKNAVINSIASNIGLVGLGAMGGFDSFRQKWGWKGNDPGATYQQYRKEGRASGASSDAAVSEAIAQAKANGPTPEFRALFGGIEPSVAGTTAEKVSAFAKSLGLAYEAPAPSPLAAQASKIAPVAPLTAEALKAQAGVKAPDTTPLPAETLPTVEPPVETSTETTGDQNASEISPPTEVHGNVQPLEESTGQLPVTQGIGGILPQATGGLPDQASEPQAPPEQTAEVAPKETPLEVLPNVLRSITVQTPKGNRRATVSARMEGDKAVLTRVELHNDATGSYEIFNIPSGGKKFATLDDAAQAGFDLVRNKFPEVKSVESTPEQSPPVSDQGAGQPSGSVPVSAGDKPTAAVPETAPEKALGFRGWRLQGRTIRHATPGETITPEQASDIEAQVNQVGGETVYNQGSGTVSVRGLTSRQLQSLEDSFGNRALQAEKRNATAAQKASEVAQRESERAKALSDNPATQWIDENFGADAMNAFNKLALVKFLSGESPKFVGMVNQKWIPGLEKLGAKVGDKVDWKSLKAKYEASLKPIPPSSPTGEAGAVPETAPAKESAVQSAASRFRPREQIQFEKPLVGPSGAKLKAYEWKWQPEEYVDKRGEDKVRRVSNWDEAEASAETGRDLVHQFVVEMPDGDQRLVSAETVPQLLGYTEKAATGKLKLTSLISATKTLAKLKMQLAVAESKLAENERIDREVKQIPPPPVVNEGKAFKSSDSRAQRFSLGPDYSGIFQVQHEPGPATPYTINSLHTNFWEAQAVKRGKVRVLESTYDLKRRIERQEKKLNASTLTAPTPPNDAPPEQSVQAGGQKPSLLEYAKSKLPKSVADKLVDESQAESFRAQYEKDNGKIIDAPKQAIAKVKEQVKEVAQTEGQRTAKEVKSEIVQRIENEIDRTIEESQKETPLVKREDGSYSAGNAIGEITQKGDKFSVSAKRIGSKDSFRSAFDTLEDAEWAIHALGSVGKGQATIDIPGDGKFTVHHDGEQLLGLWKRARSIKTDAGKSSPAPEINKGRVQIHEIAEKAMKVYGDAEKAAAHLESQAVNEGLIEDIGMEPPEVSLLKDAADFLREQTPLRKAENAVRVVQEKVDQLKGTVENHPKYIENLRKEIADLEAAKPFSKWRKFERSKPTRLKDAVRDLEKAQQALPKAEAELVKAQDAVEKLKPAKAEPAPSQPPADKLPPAQSAQKISPDLAKRLLALPHEQVGYPSGDHNVRLRQEVLQALTGTKPPISKSGASVVRDALTRHFGQDPAKLAGIEKEDVIREGLERIVKPSESSTTPEIPIAQSVAPEVATKPAETRSPAEILSQAKRVKIKAPEGATALRVTDKSGRSSVQSLSEINKGDNVFRGVEIAKVEPGTIGRDKKFVPMKGGVEVQDTQPFGGMGAAVPGEFSQPTIGDLLSPELRPEFNRFTGPRAEASNEQPAPSFLNRALGFLSGIRESNISDAFKGWIGTMAGKTFPKTTLLDRQLGELGGRWVASRAAASPSATLFVNDVLSGLDVDSTKFDAALKADNLLSIRDSFREEAAKLLAKAQKEGSPEIADQAQKLQEAADNVNTLLGSKNFPFQDEAELERYFREPQVAEAIKRHRDDWEQTIEPLYRITQSIDPDVELPTRGKYSQARINLNPIVEGEYRPATGPIVGSSGSLTGTMRKMNPFARRAKGTGQAYVLNYAETMANSFAKQLEIANKKAFEDKLLSTGNAKISDPGQSITLDDGAATKGYPLVRKPYQNKWIYVRANLSGEYEIAANVILNPYRDKLIAQAFGVFNKAALAGLTDATVHVENLGTALLQVPGGSGTSLIMDGLLSAMGRLDIPVMLARAGIKALPSIGETKLWDNYLKEHLPKAIVGAVNKALLKRMGQLASIAEINASRMDAVHSRIPGIAQISRTVMGADRLTRQLLDDTFQNLVDAGWVTRTETNRREFINQAGNYNLRAQGSWMRLLRQTGVAPFATAARNFATLGIRGVTLNPGVKASSVKAAAALRANMLAKWIGSAVLVAAINYLTTGLLLGRPGVRFGSIDTGKNDKNGNPLSFDALAFTGQSRSMRTVGARSAIEAARRGLHRSDVVQAATRDIANVGLSTVAGPGPRAAMVALTGYPPAISVGRSSRVAPPGESQLLENFKAAAWESNPLLASIHEYSKSGGSLAGALSRQMPRFTLTPGKQPDMIKNYPKIVEGAQSSEFTEDVIRVARTLPKSERTHFVKEQIARLPKDRQDKAWSEVKRRQVFK